jgi:hypothetical protein
MVSSERYPVMDETKHMEMVFAMQGCAVPFCAKLQGNFLPAAA